MFYKFLIQLVIFISIIYLVRRFFAGVFRNPKKSASENNGADNLSTQMVKDPVCGMYMDSRLAVRLENTNGTFYFCSEKCKTKFLDVPSGTETGSTAAK